MRAVRVDPRDVRAEGSVEAWRVYFHRWQSESAGSAYVREEFRLSGATDVRSVLRWADEQADGRAYVVYLELPSPQGPTLIRVQGDEPE